jgi:tricorn protease
VLRDGDPAPLLPFIAQPHPDAHAGEALAETRIDFDGIEGRIAPLPLKPRAYSELAAGPPGVLFIRYRVWPEAPGGSRRSKTPLYRYDLSSHDWSEVTDDVDEFALVAGAETVLYSTADGLFVKPTHGEDAEARAIDLSAVEIEVDPAAEWRQIYREAWRLMRDYFYDPNHHGRDLDALSEHFAAYLPAITRRDDLNFLLREMLGQVSISHMGIRGGDTPRPAAGPERIGLLGARFEIDHGRYRIAEIYRPGMSDRTNGLAAAAPLAQPGVGAREGDYLLAVDGRQIDASVNLYAAFAGTAGRPVTLRFGPDPAGEGAREAVVLPVPGENGIQRAAWFEANRKRVEELSGGRIGYLSVPDYGPGAIEEFIGQLAAQADKDALVIDQRFGPGGITSDTLVQMLTAAPLHNYAFPYGEDLTVPTTQARGPKVLLINEHNGSASETFPLMFQLAGAGTIVGKRTAGAGTGGALDYPRLIDGGRIVIPNRASYDPVAGVWAENDGLHPDVEVELWPADWRQGRDAQLEKAVEIALEQADAAPAPVAHRPPYPVHPD